MNLHLGSVKCSRNRDGVVLTGVVDQDNQIDNTLRHHFVIGTTKRSRRILRGHYDNNFLTVKHWF